MSTYTIIKLVKLVLLVGFILSTVIFYLKKSTDQLGINKLIAKSQKLEEQNLINEAIEKYKYALAEALGFKYLSKITLDELKDNLNTNGWYVLNELSRVYKNNNIDFSMDNWSAIKTRINNIETPPSKEQIQKNITDEFKKLP